MVRTRIAPSPTGIDIHIGNLYTALINWAYARKNKGQFIIRVEDTDRERYVKGSEEKILSTLKAYGLNYDEGPDTGGHYAPYRQSERLAIYQKYAKELVDKGDAYYCFCTKERLEQVRKEQLAKKQIPKYDRYCLNHVKDAEERVSKGEKYVIRLKVPENREIVFNDLIRGEIKFHSNNLDDQVLIKSDGFPTYHLAVVIDDHLMQISHIIRAEEWISSTPKHILLYEAFGWEKPIFAHLPILRNPDRSKLSKRKNPVWASWYLDQGYLPEAILNYLSLMGWSHPEQKEIFTLDEFVEKVDLKDISPVGPAFDPVKLEWMNGIYIRNLSKSELKYRIAKFLKNKYPNVVYPLNMIEKTVPLIQERIKKFSDYLTLCEFLFKETESYEIDLSKAKNVFQKVIEPLKAIEWRADYIGNALQYTAKELKMKNSEFFMMLRVAITGKKISPPLNESMEVLGKDECLERLKKLFS